MFLVVGLGNPGSEYARNRHNIGFMAVEALAERYGAGSWSKKFSGQICEARGAQKLLFLKPQTYMNLSGESVQPCMQFYKLQPEQVIVLYDDLDLPTGKIRVKKGGGHGGHNGLKSMDSHVGKEYWRIRIGIGRPQGEQEVTNHVLGDFSKAERAVQEEMIASIVRHFDLMLAGDEAGFMNKVALDTKVEAPKPAAK